MREGSYSSAQQTLTPEAASVLKHSLSLARRRNHAQVTPLHVAETLLSSRLSLFRRACLKSQPITAHPFQCRALELCFNVALNRLQAAPANFPHPSLSNALIAAVKRGQTNQRRCSMTMTDQPVSPLAKLDLEHLVLSILDDPSVSRVMNEAGFSSTSVKSCCLDDDDSSSIFRCYDSSPGGIFSTPSSPKKLIATETEDVRLLVDVLMGNGSKRRNCVIVGDNLVLTEGIVAGLMKRTQEGGDVPAELKSAHFIKCQFPSAPLMLMKKEEVELNVAELKRKVDAILGGGGDKGVVILTGEMSWTIQEQGCGGYSPADHLVEEIGRLMCFYSDVSAKVWLVGTANYQTYMKNKMLKQPPLDAQWLIQPLFVPSAGLGLSLHETKLGECCPECMAKFEEEAAKTIYWMKYQQDNVTSLKRKWSSICEELHPNRQDGDNAGQGFFGKNSCHNGSYPWWPTYGSRIPDDQSILLAHDSFLKSKQSPISVPRFRRQKSCHIEFDGGSPGLKTTLSLGNSPVSDDAAADKATLELVMCTLLQENVPWQSGSIPRIVQALMRSKEMKADTWFLIQGNDIIGKRRLARGIAQLLHGSPDSLIHMNLRNISGNNCEMLKGALSDHDRQVLLLENVDFADVELSEFLENGFRYGLGTLCKNVEGKKNFYHPIFILAKSDDNASSAPVLEMEILVYKGATSATIVEDSNKMNPKKEECLDLNMKAEEEEYGHDEHKSLSFLHLIKNRLVFNRDSVQDKKIREMFLSNFMISFEQVFGPQSLEFFSVQDKAVDEISLGSATFLHSVFQEWLKHAFEPSLKSISREGSEEFKVRLLVGGNGGGDQSTGFKGSCLPFCVPIRYMD